MKFGAMQNIYQNLKNERTDVLIMIIPYCYCNLHQCLQLLERPCSAGISPSKSRNFEID